MSTDAYRAIYDAAFAQLDISWQKEMIVQSITCMADTIQNQQTRPSVLMRPRIFIDGNQWCCLYGDNIQDGVAGFGDTPEAAACDFDTSWHNSKPPKLMFPSAAEVLASFPSIRRSES